MITEPISVNRTYECCEETLGHGVVVAVTDGAHRRQDTGLAAALGEVDRSVLAALVAVVDDAVGTVLPQRHVQRAANEFALQVCRHAPAGDTPAEHIEHDRQVDKVRQIGM